jgi:hypothetical protein
LRVYQFRHPSDFRQPETGFRREGLH